MKAVDVNVDVDDVLTWPAGLREHVDLWLQRLQEAPPTPDEPEIGWDADEPLLDLLGGRPLQAYHCTCLLDHEPAQIRAQGLRLLSRELIEERIDAAFASGAITVDEAELLRLSHVYRGRDHHNRTGQVWLFAGQAALDEPTDLRPLLTTWGGEGMYMARMDPRAVLERLGRPAIVVVDLSPSMLDPKRLMGRLMAAFIGARRSAPVSAAIQIREPVPPSAVLDIWQPGHPSYDGHPRLPRR